MDEKFRKPWRRASGGKTSGKNAKAALIIAIVVAVIIVVVGLVLHKCTNDSKEIDEYNYAIHSYEPVILSNYLDVYKNAPKERREAITARLKMIEAMDSQWKAAVKSSSSDSLQHFIDRYPDSKYRKQALQIIDSLDFIECRDSNTEASYLAYLDEHSDGAYYENAHEGLRRIRAKNVTTEERIMVSDIMRSFLLCVNINNEDGLMSTVAENLTLLDNTSATRGDVADFLRSLYTDDVKNITWSTVGNLDISKREVGDFNYEYSVIFIVNSVVNKADDSQTEDKYRIRVTVNPDGLISEFRMSKVVETEEPKE